MWRESACTSGQSGPSWCRGCRWPRVDWPSPGLSGHSSSASCCCSIRSSSATSWRPSGLSRCLLEKLRVYRRVDVQHYSRGHGVLQTSAIHCRKCAAWSQYMKRERKGYQVFQIIFNFWVPKKKNCSHFYILLKFDNLYYFYPSKYYFISFFKIILFFSGNCQSDSVQCKSIQRGKFVFINNNSHDDKNYSSATLVSFS